MQFEALLCVEWRSVEGVDCETFFGWDLLLVEIEVRLFFTSGTVVVPVSALDAVFIIVGDLNGLVPASTLDVVFIAFGVLNGLVWQSLEICHLDEAENPWVVVVSFNVVDADCVVFLGWEDDGLCNALEDDETC